MGKETLTPKQRLFCYEYVLDHNGKRSYQAAYPNCKAPGSAESQASRLLRNDKVKKFIADLEKRKLDKLDFTATDVLNALCSIGFAETAKPPNTSDRVKALAELLRHFELARGMKMSRQTMASWKPWSRKRVNRHGKNKHLSFSAILRQAAPGAHLVVQNITCERQKRNNCRRRYTIR